MKWMPHVQVIFSTIKVCVYVHYWCNKYNGVVTLGEFSIHKVNCNFELFSFHWTGCGNFFVVVLVYMPKLKVNSRQFLDVSCGSVMLLYLAIYTVVDLYIAVTNKAKE